MKMELKPYDEYKETNIQWLGKIPIGWNTMKTKRILKETSIKNYPDEPLLSATQKRGVIPRSMLDTRVVMPMGNFETFKLVDKGDFVISLRSFQGGLEYSNYRGIVSPAYTVLKTIKDINHLYLKYLLKSQNFIFELQRNVTGIRQGKNIDVNDFKKIILPIPSNGEQDKIVRFLDVNLSKIHRFINKKNHLIAVLKELKQSIINDAVTRGLDLNVKMKPSGIEWLGIVPVHWDIKPLKQFVYSNVVSLTEGANPDKLIKYIDISSVSFGQITVKPMEMLFKDAPSRARRVIRTGDTIISTVRTYLRAICYIDEEYDNCIASTGFTVLTPKCGVYPLFVSYVLSSYSFLNRVTSNSIGIAYPAISESKLLSLKVAIPPSIDEQKAIVENVIAHCEKYDSLILKTQREIDLIKEYRTRLISDVVTGKVDVRNVEVEEILPDTDLELVDDEAEDLDDTIDEGFDDNDVN